MLVGAVAVAVEAEAGSGSLWMVVVGVSAPSGPSDPSARSASVPQKEGRRGAGAGVTGREGRSKAVGKSVSFMDGRRGFRFRNEGSEEEGGMSEVGDIMSSVVEDGTAAAVSPDGGTFDEAEGWERENLGFRCCC